MVPLAKLNAARDDLFLHPAASPSPPSMLAALRAAQLGDRVANVLISNAARWGSEGPAVAARSRTGRRG